MIPPSASAGRAAYYVVGITNKVDGSAPPPLDLSTDATAGLELLAQSTHDGVLLVECRSSDAEQVIIKELEDLSARSEAEVYVCAPCRIPIATWTRNRLLADDRVAQLFNETGLSIFPDAVNKEDISILFKLATDQIEHAHQVLAEKHKHIRVGHEQFAFKELGSRGGLRFDLILEHDAKINCILQSGPWIPLVKRLLNIADDTEVPCLVSVVYSLPGAESQSWHADGVPADPSYAVCIFMPLIDLDGDTGYTQFWPGTHKSKALLGFGPAAEVCGATFDGILATGDILMYDYGTLHRGIGNNSALRRPVLQAVYHVPSWKDTKNYGNISLFD
ncbi:hypothetical protein PhCBS80983_g02937 [Powellomyces hirtus]|uniref:Fe2OG dioxygenase domain-containing protein n=1 Tax=Powellomyces hirtus TaxID=109895 RepID=A0A507E6J0_9FUNG|nr:hypothetical protein PhCBS80983_g02937 [Powellomyces hirtus]